MFYRIDSRLKKQEEQVVVKIDLISRFFCQIMNIQEERGMGQIWQSATMLKKVCFCPAQKITF